MDVRARAPHNCTRSRKRSSSKDEGVFSAAPFPELTTGPVEIAPGTFGGWAANIRADQSD